MWNHRFGRRSLLRTQEKSEVNFFIHRSISKHLGWIDFCIFQSTCSTPLIFASQHVLSQEIPKNTSQARGGLLRLLAISCCAWERLEVSTSQQHDVSLCFSAKIEVICARKPGPS